MFVVASDFDDFPYNLPDLDSKANTFAAYVTAKEEEGLRPLLGQLLYDAFVDGLSALPAEWLPATDYAVDALVVKGNDVWKSLQNPNVAQPVVEGLFWTIEEEDNKWLRLKNGATYKEGKRKWDGVKALLVPYIYSYWVGDQQQNLTGVAVVQGKTENAQPVSSKYKVVNSFNDYSRRAGNCRSEFNSLYGFLKDNESDYENREFMDPGRMNVFNL